MAVFQEVLPHSLVCVRDLVTPRRVDIAVKWRFFRHLLSGDDPDSERVYRWHIEARKVANAQIGWGMDSKSGTDQYVEDCRNLIASMWEHGFLPQFAIPLSVEGELFGGAHRTACALALKLPEVPITRIDGPVTAPAWDWPWFLVARMVDNRISERDLARVHQDWEELINSRFWHRPSWEFSSTATTSQ